MFWKEIVMPNKSFLKLSHFKIYDPIIPIFRIIFILVLISLSLLRNDLKYNKQGFIFLVIYFIYALTILIFKKIRKSIVLKYPFMIGIFETLMMSYGIIYSGGSQSYFYYLYILIIAFYAIIYNILYSSIITTFCLISYISILVFLGERISYHIIFQIIFLGAFALFTGIISGKISKYNIKLATIDQLTSLYNRQYLYGELERLFDYSNKYKNTFAIVVIDVNDFKLINDQKGHLEGDRILVEISNQIKKNISEYDFAARFGGDEFVIVLIDKDRKSVSAVCEKLVADIKYIFSDEITISIGYAVYPQDGKNDKELFHVADMAMYKDKVERKDKSLIKS